MNFDNKFTFDWHNGTEPSTELKTNGFQGGYKPPAGVFNWFWNKVIKCITELQTKLSGVDTDLSRVDTDLSRVDTALSGKVDKVNGKGLSTNDYTTEEKSKVSAIFANNTNNAGNATALGGKTTSKGAYDFATGYQTTAIGGASFASGSSSNEASRFIYIGDHLKTDEEIISEWQSKPFLLASGYCSHAVGFNAMASGNNSHAEGNETIASGNNSHAEGNETIASGNNSHAGGFRTVANDFQFVTGKFNNDVEGCVDENEQDATKSIFIVGYGTEVTPANALRITSAGKCYGANAFIGSGADYAEYFEYIDGNVDNEDRRGLFVTLDGDKIRIANANDDYILGVVSGNPSVIGDAQSENWHKMYLKDVFGEPISETVEIPETIDEKTGETIPAHTVKRYKVNPEYDREQEYISREFRQEWACIGLLGKLIVVDDGTCVVNGYCNVSSTGAATASETGYKVMKRLDDTHIQILLK